ncbi:hypothetical protein GCM10027289_22050 [Tsukamurella serpentis]
MSKFQPSRSQVPVDERSVLATVPGLPWWGAVLTLLAFAAVGAVAAGEFAGANAGMLAITVGAIVAVLAVRNRALFTAMVQPPLVIATAIPVYRWFALPSPRSTSKILTDVLFPLISLFPWMFWITVIVLLIGGARMFLYHRLTATARSAQRSGSAPAKPAKAGAKKAPESAGLPLGERLRAAAARMRPAPAAAAATAGGAAGTRVSAEKRSERHQGTAHRSRPDRGETRRTPSSEGAPRRALTRDEVARRDEGAPATAVNRVVRPDSGRIRRGQPPRRPADDERAAGMPHGARPRPPVAYGDRPRPFPGEPRDPRRDPDRRDPRARGGRELDPRQGASGPGASGPRAAVPRPAARDYRREAREIDRARGVDDPRARPARDRSAIPRDDYGSLPRISGSRAAQPDLPSLQRDPDRAARRSEARNNPSRYEHYRPPRYRPASEESAVETDFRDDFAEPDEPPRQIRRHRYKD